MEEAKLELGALFASTAKQESWARDMRLRIYTSLVMRFGKEYRPIIIAACNQYKAWHHWTLWQNGTREELIEAVQAAIEKTKAV